MSYSCVRHGWQHIYKPCPACMPKITVTADTINLGVINTLTVESLQAELTDLKAKYEKAVSALKSIAAEHLCQHYIDKMPETTIEDTRIARETLAELGEK